jgi:outer membrane receptor protein involved in Fe transport
MFPADQIKSVEVITAPSARYDGEGTAGIINIITKKKQVDGLAGSFNLAPGNRQTTTSLNLNAAKGRFGLNGGAFMVYSNPRDGVFRFERQDTLDNQVRSLAQNGKTETSRLGFHGNFGAYYDINAYNSINSNINFRGFGFDRDGNTDANFNDPFNNLSQTTSRNNLSETINSGFDWNTDYRRTFPNSEREFSVGLQFSGSQDDADNKLLQTGNFENLNIDEKSKNESTNLETTLQADYIHPFSKNVKLETGVKGILRTIDSDFRFDTLYVEQSTYLRDASRSDVFDYRQDVYAGYASLNTNFAEKFGLIAGARYERTEISGDYKFDETEFANDYWNLLPSAIFSYKTNQFSSARLSYNQRIQRPSLRFINPYTDQQDRNNISFGNPSLDPELSHNFEAGYSTFLKGVVLNGSLYHRLTNDVIESITRVDETEGFSFTTFDNVGKSKAYGISLFGSGTVKKIWQLRGNVDVRRLEITANRPDLTQSNTGYEYNANVSSTVSLPGKIKIELWSMLRSPRVTLQGTQATFWMYSLGAQKEVFGKRGSIGIRIANLFHRALNFDTKLEGEGFFQNSFFEYPFRSYGLSFNYRFGKLDFKDKEHKSKVKNTDQKEGGENNF